VARLITAPTAYEVGSNEVLFLAGGITNCPDWQKEFFSSIENLPNLDVLNPRREVWDAKDLTAREGQIMWEHQGLQRCSMISFWFCKETIQPTALLEFGRWSALVTPYITTDLEHLPRYHTEIRDRYAVGLNLIQERKRIFVGIHPEYEKRKDIEIQLELERSGHSISYTLEDLSAQIQKWVTKRPLKASP